MRSEKRSSAGSLHSTFRTAERLAEKSGATGVGCHPRPDLPRRIMPDVLGVPAFQVGHPVSVRILVESDDASGHGLTSTVIGSHDSSGFPFCAKSTVAG